MVTKEEKRVEKQTVEHAATPSTEGNLAKAHTEVLARPSGFALGTTPEEIMASFYESCGIRPQDMEVIVSGKLPFWPAMAMAICGGILMGRREVPTRFTSTENPKGLVGIYTVQLTQPCQGALVIPPAVGAPITQTELEYIDMQPGQNITVLERSMLKELRMRINQKVGILCLGLVQGKKFPYWDYRVIGERRTAEQIQAAAQLAMAEMQFKQLPPAQSR